MHLYLFTILLRLRKHKVSMRQRSRFGHRAPSADDTELKKGGVVEWNEWW